MDWYFPSTFSYSLPVMGNVRSILTLRSPIRASKEDRPQRLEPARPPAQVFEAPTPPGIGALETSSASARVPGQAVPEMAREVLRAAGADASANAAQQMLDGAPTLSRTLRLFAHQWERAQDPASRAAIAQRALRHFWVNGHEQTPALGRRLEPLPLAEGYAQDLGFARLEVDGSSGSMISLAGERVPLKVDGKDNRPEKLLQAINLSQFGKPTVVAPTGALERTADFSITNAHWANHLSLLAYASRSVVEERLRAWGFEMETFSWLDSRTGNAGFVVADADGNIHTIFRGSDSLGDVGTDTDAKLIPAPWDQRVGVHRGFSNALNSVWTEMVTAIQRAEAKVGKDGAHFFSGHSLGGAMAQIAALRLANGGLIEASTSQVYTLGGPRVGNEGFANVYNAAIPATYRMVNHDAGGVVAWQDTVPSLPPKWMGFRHVGHLVRLQAAGVQLVRLPAPSGTAARRLESVELPGILEATAEPALDATDPGDQQIESLRGEELQQLLEDVSREAIAEETEPSSATEATPAIGAGLEPQAFALDSRQAGLEAAEVDVGWAMPRTSYHSSTLYLQRTGERVWEDWRPW